MAKTMFVSKDDVGYFHYAQNHLFFNIRIVLSASRPKLSLFPMKEVNCFDSCQNYVCFDITIRLLPLWPKTSTSLILEEGCFPHV